MTPPRKLYLIDGHSYIFRAFYAVQPLSSPDGRPTNAVFGFHQMLRKLLDQEAPPYLGVVFDTGVPTFRHKLEPSYKANRSDPPESLIPQFDMIRRLVEAYDIPTFSREGFEADDIMGTLARRAEADGFEVVLVTGDKDLAQLVTDHVTLLDTMKDVRTDREGVRTRFGVTPEQIPDLLALCGDTSDNVKGVPGIGEKGARALLEEFGSMAALLDRAGDVRQGRYRKALTESPEAGPRSLELVTIHTDLALEWNPQEFLRTDPDPQRLRALFEEFGFRSFLAALPTPRTLPIEGYRLVATHEELADLLPRLRAARPLSFDLETTSIDPMRAELVGFALAWAPGQAAYIPVAHEGLGAQLDRAAAIEAIGPILADPDVPKLAQNAKYDITVLARRGVEVRGLTEDPMLASYLLAPGRQVHSLDRIAAERLQHRTIRYEEVAGKGKDEIPFARVPLEQARDYACEDADVALRAIEVLMADLRRDGMESLYRDIEIPLVPVLVAMERHGVRIDPDRLGRLSSDFAEEQQQLHALAMEQAGTEFNPDSPKQLQEILFERLRLPKGRRTKTGYSTDATVLERLAFHHPLPGTILEYRTLTKLRNTYLDALPKLIHPETGRVHTDYNQAVTATGRLSSSNPNLQNIPVRTVAGRNIRRAFIPEPGWRFVSADYSQVELRILAHFSDDKILQGAFRRGEDIHTRTAAEVLDISPALVTKEQRRDAKAINFGVVYGMSAHGLAEQIGIPRREAQRFIDAYFERYAGAAAWIHGTLEAARTNGYAHTLFHRRRDIPDIHSRDPRVRGFAERIAVNTPIQGTAADIIKIAMIRVHDRLQREDSRARMVLQVHDELVLEAPPEDVPAVAALLREEMSGALTLDVPLVVDVRTGENWADLDDVGA